MTQARSREVQAMVGKARGKPKAPKVLRAERFELVDHTGKVCSQLTTRQDGERNEGDYAVFHLTWWPGTGA